MTEWANFRQVSNHILVLIRLAKPSCEWRRAGRIADQPDIIFGSLRSKLTFLWPYRKTPTRPDLTSGKARFIMDGAEGEARVPRLITRRGLLSVSEPGSAFPTLLLLSFLLIQLPLRRIRANRFLDFRVSFWNIS
jgi:hypothetical protein